MTTASSRRLAVACAAFVVLVLGVVAIAGPITPPDPPGPTMRPLDHVEARIPLQYIGDSVNAMYSITEPGSYYLLGDVVHDGLRHGVEILVADVSLDLNGFAIRGSDGVTGTGVSVSNSASHIRISGGIITGWGMGIQALGAPQSMYTDLVISDNGGDGLRVGAFSTIRNVVAHGNGWDGIEAHSNSVIEFCTVGANGGHGVNAGSTNLVRNVNAGENGGDGIRAGAASSVFDCVTEANTGTLGGEFGSGVYLDGIGVVERCVAHGNALHGVYAGEESIVSDCVAYWNDSDGIHAEAYCRIEGNILRFNGDDGCEFGIGSRVLNNLSRGNDFGFYDNGVANSGAVVQSNSAIGNVYDGFLLIGTGCVVSGNIARDNGQDDYGMTASNHQCGEIITASGVVGAVSPFANFQPPATTSASSADAVAEPGKPTIR